MNNFKRSTNNNNNKVKDNKLKNSTIGPIRSSNNQNLSLFDNIETNHVIVISIIENRSREVCICNIDTKNVSLLEIYIFIDSHSYVETISAIQNIKPQEILIPDSCRNSILSRKIENLSKQSNFRLIYISRQYFDQDRGAEMLRRVIQGENDADLTAKYTVLAGSYGLMRYIENCTGYNYVNHSVRLSFNTEVNKERLIIDRRTLLNLELLTNLNDGSQKNSLFSILNYTKTDVGNRLLRQNIMSPMLDVVTLETRLDVLDLLLKDNKNFMSLQNVLSKFPDLDRMLIGLTTLPKKLSNMSARRSIDTIIYLKQTLKNLQILNNEITHILNNLSTDQSSSRLLQTIQSTINQNEFRYILEIISDFITESTSFSKSSHEMRHQECFAVKSGLDGKLDLARVNYLQSVEDIHNIAENYCNDLGYPVKVVYTASRGFHISVPANLQPFPIGFIQPVQNSRNIACTTEEIQSLSDKSKDSIDKALELTNDIIANKLEEIRRFLDVLFVMVDAIALIDMLCSYVELINTSTETYTRPKLTYSQNNNDTIVIKSGRHPIITKYKPVSLDSTDDGNIKGFIPNDFKIGPLDNVQIITGPNGSGKTVYIKQISVIIIMAQIGCYVPANHAVIAVRDRLLSRLGNNDDMEHNLSTFTNEMKDISYIINNITPRSLVIIDELGRGTSNIDGLSIAFAIAESLIQSSAFTLFVTHYSQITSLSNLYNNVKNLHMKATLEYIQISNVNPNITGDITIELKYLHTVSDGPSDMKSGYGILMAEKCCFPNDIIMESKRIQQIVRSQYPILISDLSIDVVGNYIRTILEQLLLLRNSYIDNIQLCKVIQSLREKISYDLESQIIRYINNIDNQIYNNKTNRIVNSKSTINNITAVNRISKSKNDNKTNYNETKESNKKIRSNIIITPTSYINSNIGNKDKLSDVLNDIDLSPIDINIPDEYDYNADDNVDSDSFIKRIKRDNELNSDNNNSVI